MTWLLRRTAYCHPFIVDVYRNPTHFSTSDSRRAFHIPRLKFHVLKHLNSMKQEQFLDNAAAGMQSADPELE